MPNNPTKVIARCGWCRVPTAMVLDRPAYLALDMIRAVEVNLPLDTGARHRQASAKVVAYLQTRPRESVQRKAVLGQLLNTDLADFEAGCHPWCGVELP